MSFVKDNAWTDAELTILKPLWLEGRSASEIARCLPGRTKNAVIGVAHRKGWTVESRQPASRPLSSPLVVKRDRQAGAINARKGRPKPKSGPIAMLSQFKSDASPETRERCAAAGQAKIEAVEVAANDDAIPLMDRGRYQCAWPMGVPARPAEQMCCGQRVQMDAERAVPAYCAHHGKQAVSATQPKRKVPTEPSVQRRAA